MAAGSLLLVVPSVRGADGVDLRSRSRRRREEKERRRKWEEAEHEARMQEVDRRFQAYVPLSQAQSRAWRTTRRKKRKKKKLSKSSSSRAVRTWKPGHISASPLPACSSSLSASRPRCTRKWIPYSTRCWVQQRMQVHASELEAIFGRIPHNFYVMRFSESGHFSTTPWYLAPLFGAGFA